LGQLFPAVYGYHARILRHGQILDSQALAHCLDLFQKAGGDNRG
jgi:hypothetical protein